MTKEAPIYETLGPISPDEADEAFNSREPRRILYALLRMALHGPDWAEAERRALEFAAHPDVWIRRNAATSLGHIARLHGRLEVAAAVSTLLSLRDDSEVADWADASLDDLEMFMGVDWRQYVRRRRIAGA